MREIKHIVIHCTATHEEVKVPNIISYWKNHLKWKNPGYHYIIDREGQLTELTSIRHIANGVRGYNHNSIHIAYVGGIDNFHNPMDNRTPKQILKMLDIIIQLKEKFPKAEIKGHRDFPGVNKGCPSFEVKEWLSHVGFKND